METKICKKCGRENYVDMKFCSECGSSFSKKTEEEELIFCPECGTKNKKGECFCEECGAKLDENDEEELSIDRTTEEEPEEEEEYTFCPECGTKNKVTEKFCEECGSNLNEDLEDEEIDTSEEDLIEEETSSEEPVEEKTEEEEEEYIFCSECGTKNKVTEKFCEECGSNLNEDSDDEKSKEEIDTLQEDLIEEEISSEEPAEEKKEEEEDEEYIFCSECGTKNKSTEKFCEECGSNLNEDSDDEESKEEIDTLQEDLVEDEPSSEELVEEKIEEDEEYIFCPECGTKNKVTEKFCEECGSSLNEDLGGEKFGEEDKNTESKNKDKEEKSKEKVPTKVSEKVKKPSKDFEESNQTENRKKGQKNSNSKKPKLLVIVVIILVIAIAGGVCYKTGIIDNLFTKKSEPKAEINKDGWSDWVEKLPKDITEKNYTIEEKTEYASKTKKTKTSNKKTLKGWTLYDTENAAGNQTETVKGIEEIKKFEAKDDIKITNKENIKEKYTAILCGYYTTPKDKNRFYSPKTAKPYCEEEDSYSLTEESEERDSGTYKVGDDYQDKSYTNSDGNTIYYKVIKVTPTEVKFTYQTSEGTVYHFYKWSSWSKYGDKKVEEDENTKVKTRTVYRYKSKTK